MNLGTNTAIFMLFFGVALFEAIQSKRWVVATFFMIVGLYFLYQDNKKKQR